MDTLTITIPAGLVDVIVSIIDFVLFVTTCMIKGGIALWAICFSLWLVGILLTVAYKTIKSLITTNK